MIRPAEFADLSYIMEIYAIAREYMQKNGNGQQWGENFPPKSLLECDVRQKCLYVLHENGKVHGVFAFLMGDDPSYEYIEKGSWPNDKPYGTIHRIASDGKIKGVFEKCLAFCMEQSDNLRIDTHENNKTMQHLIEKNGFEKCGVIYVSDGSPRIAYQYSKDK